MFLRKSWFVLISLFFIFSIVHAEDINLELKMPTETFYPGAPCKLDLKIQNSGMALDAQLFVALNVGTYDYWFYPTWCQYPNEVDYEDISIPQNFEIPKVLIPEFVWPSGIGEFMGAMFLAAIVDDGDLKSNIETYTFGWTNSKPSPTPCPSTATPTAAPNTPTSTPFPATPTPPMANFVYIPGNVFQMGSPSYELCRWSDEDIHTISISQGFYIQSTEVTQQQWVNMFGNNPSHFYGMDRPVEQVSWYDCCIYCNQLSRDQGFRPCYYSDYSCQTVFQGTPPVVSGTVYWKLDADGYRLPTEAEWEYVCRAGTITAYNNGLDNTSCYDADPNLDPLAWYDSNSGNMTHDVATKLGNSWGLYDMHGNVNEWCWDWYDENYYSSSPSVDPRGPSSGSYNVVRGGAHQGSAALGCRSASRWYYLPAERYNTLGFRLLRPNT